jgi:succinate dehydrogenase / fumarate reductase membrane anchor subunit
MVKPCGALRGSGLLDWVVQRVSAVILAIYLFAGIAALAMHQAEPLSYSMWAAWFAPVWMKVATLITIAALCVHAWVGMWSVATDYLHGALRCLFLGATLVGLMVCLGWGVVILWGL